MARVSVSMPFVFTWRDEKRHRSGTFWDDIPEHPVAPGAEVHGDGRPRRSPSPAMDLPTRSATRGYLPGIDEVRQRPIEPRRNAFILPEEPEEKVMEVPEAYDLTKSYRSAAQLCGVDHHTVVWSPLVWSPLVPPPPEGPARFPLA